MSSINLYSVGHYSIWFLAARFTTISFPLFLLLSIGWEILEWYLPYEFAIETNINKISDIIVNTIGFGMGSWVAMNSTNKNLKVEGNP